MLSASSLLLPPLLMLLWSGQCTADKPLLAFLIDGFRADYMDRLDSLPGFRELLHRGVTVDYMTPDFPSLSYPNYYTLMTGRHCGVHHMTGNYMWDEQSGKEFLIGLNDDSRLPFWWEGAEPLWITAQKSEKRVHMYYWPGCEVKIHGVMPSFCEMYVGSPTLGQFTDSIQSALNVLSSGTAHMVGIYWEKIDVEGHHFGPDSPEVWSAVQELDRALQTLNRGLTEKGLQDKVNVMLFSDHGMTNIKWMDRVIELDKYINMSDIIKTMDRGPVVNVWPRGPKHQQVYDALAQVPNMKVYNKSEVPERFVYSSGKFVSPLTLVAEPGWFITENKSLLPFWNNDSSGPARGWQNGWHGYDNEFMDMRAFFVAAGPDFKQNLRAAPIRSVDIYNLMCQTLGVKPLPNNGSWSRVEYLLSGAGQTTVHWVVILFSALLMLLLTGQ